MTLQTQMVLQVFLSQPTEEIWGHKLAKETGLMPGTTHPILTRLETAGWITSRREDIDPHAEGRPARRYYSLTTAGAAEASRALAAAHRPSKAALRGLTGEGAPA